MYTYLHEHIPEQTQFNHGNTYTSGVKTDSAALAAIGGTSQVATLQQWRSAMSEHGKWQWLIWGAVGSTGAASL